VLEFCRIIYPYWHVRAWTSIDLLPEDFPILDHYLMPKELFAPILDQLPFVACQLETIANSGSMGGVVPVASVPVVRSAIQRAHASEIRDSDNPYSYDATQTLLAALEYAEQQRLSFTEAIC
jgi:hypothetical protein